MAMIEFVRNYTDHSTDRGYQFDFRCDNCASGFMSSFQPSFIGAAGGLLEAAGNIFGGLLGSAGNSAYDIQRAVGGPAHDRALHQAVTEVKQKFRRCQRCGKWVCAEICWNGDVAQCVGCTPKYEQEVISLRNQAQVQATQEQLRRKAETVDYVAGIDMSPDAQVRFRPVKQAAVHPNLPQPGEVLPSQLGRQDAISPGMVPSPLESGASAAPLASCQACGASVSGSKFCPECGSKVLTPQTCSSCGQVSVPAARFCGDCGTKLS